MKIRTDSASSSAQLAGYLRRCACTVAFVDDWTLDVDVQSGALSARHAQVELDAYLRVWEAMTPGGCVERLETQTTT